ncbi:transcriptional regulator PpsR [Caldichromatium japonicum]|uniref:transcriptional regulator PpsR n=1 Tax=Caldichromatium japonicum TaxID=2699430 RepID=UPI001FE9980A|nr:transcriptional regulator PpsR [Caldichromatium japonicum]
MTLFNTPQDRLGTLAPQMAAALIEGLADIAFVLDPAGLIQDIAFGSDDLRNELDANWIGQPWTATVSLDTRPNLESLLDESKQQRLTRWRQATHRGRRGADIPVQYRLLRLKEEDSPILAIGRSLQGFVVLQQQLIDAQQALERDYWRYRQIETRYRLLFRMVGEAILILDAPTQRIVEANPTAGQCLGETPARLVGRHFPEGFDPESTQAINGLLAGARTAGRSDDVRARLSDGAESFLVSASLLRQENASFILVRLMPIQTDAIGSLPEVKSRYLYLIENAPDAVVITDAEGRVLTANTTFLSLIEVAAEQQARGEPLERWLGRPGVDVNVLLANLRQDTKVRLFSTILRGEYGSTTDVEVSATSVRTAERPYFGFFIRDIGRRLQAEPPATPEQNRWLDQLTERVGRVPLKELVRESTDTIERLCIETALKLTGDNRASAAELLGLSRQSLYVKIDRYGLAAEHADQSVETPAQDS